MLVIYASKSNVMVITTKQNALHTCDVEINIYIVSTRLKQIGYTDYLGIKLDKHLLRIEQVDDLCMSMVLSYHDFAG